MALRRPRVLVDAQAFQNPWSAERGIGRYVGELLNALEGVEPDLELSFALNPDLAVPRQIDRLTTGGRVTFSDHLSAGDADVFHVPSPFEPAPIDRVWPPAVRGIPLVVTVHDLIPFVLSDLYLRSPSESRWFKTRLELARRAARVIAVSSATADDLVERAAIRQERIVVVSEAPAERFKPHPDRSKALQEAQAALPRLREGFVFYPGGMDRRKNIVRLIDAYAGLPKEVRRGHQLVVACHLTKDNRAEVDRLLNDFAVTEDVLFPGYLRDELLVLLYQGAQLAVFPSLYEGFGLPVAEAIACGTPVIASRTSSIPELIDDEEALFDPYDPRSIRQTLLRALQEPSFVEQLRRGSRLGGRNSWPEVAKETLAVYAAARRERRSVPRPRPRLALAAWFPPNLDTAADTFGLVAGLGRRSDVDAFGVTKALFLPPGVQARRLSQLDLVERARGGYDAILSIIGNGPNDAGALSVARARGGHVLLQSGELTRLYARLAGDGESRGFDRTVRTMYRGRLPRGLAKSSHITAGDVDRSGLLMTAEIVANAAKVFVRSAYAKQLLELDAGTSHAAKIAVLPVAFPKAARQQRESPDPLVVARLVRRDHDAQSLFAALALLASQSTEIRFALVVGSRKPLRSSVERLAETHGIASLVFTVPESDHASWGRLLPRAAAAVDLAAGHELVISDFLIACLATGVPTVSSNVGPVRELPDDVLAKLAPDAQPDVLAQAIGTLISEEQPTIGVAATAHARANSPERLAERIYELIFG